MTDNPDKPGPGSLEAPFLFVPHGSPEPTEWMRRHPGWVRFPATFVPHAPAAQRMIPSTNRPWPVDKRGQPWPASRFGQPLRPLDEYPPGMRAPGTAYDGPIAAGKVDADPYAPVRAYLSARPVWENPGKYAAWPRPEPAQIRQVADAAQAGMNQPHTAGTSGHTLVAASARRTLTDETGLWGLENQAPDGTPLPGSLRIVVTRPIVPPHSSGDPVLDALRTALAPAQGTTYGNVLPLAKDDATGDVRPAMPNGLRDLAHGMLDLLDASRTGTVTPEATNALAAGMLGGLGRGVAAGGREALSGRLLSAPGAAGAGAGRAATPINGATRTVPLGFEREAQFLDAAQELKSALKASGISDATVGVRGSSVTGYSLTKGTNFHPNSDVDFFVESAQLTEGYKTSNTIPGFVVPQRLLKDFPLLRAWAVKWTDTIGRKVTPGAFAPGTVPNQPAVLVK